MQLFKNLLKKLQDSTGFTAIEVRGILFFAFLLLLGLTGMYLKSEKRNTAQYSYTQADSLYARLMTAGNYEKKTDSLEAESASVSQNADSPEDKTTEKKSKKVDGGEKININAAGVTELMRLPGVGKKTAEAIVDYRTSIKRFTSLEQIMDVKGIGRKKFEKMVPSLSLQGSTP